MEAFAALGGSLNPVFATPDSLCRECVFELVAEQAYQEHHPGQVRSVIEADEINKEHIWISRRWFTDWKREIPRMHQKGKPVDPNPSEGDFGADVACPHGQLQPDTKRRILISYRVSNILVSFRV